MNIIDVVIVLVVVGAAVHGYVVGTVVQVCTLLGVAVGLFAGAALAPHVVGLTSAPASKAFVALTSFLLPAALGLALGRSVGGATVG